MKLNDIEKLYEDGFLSAEQREEAIERYRPGTRGMRRWLAYSLAALAAILITGGVVMLAEALREELTPMLKMCCGMGLLTALWLAYFALRRCMPLVAEALAVAGAGAWLANLLLLEELFHLDTPAVETGLVFLAGIVLIPFLTRQRLLIGVVAAGSGMLCLMLLSSGDSRLSLKWLADQYGMTAGMLLPLLALFWWLLAERAHGSRGLMRGYSWVGVPAFLVFLGSVQAALLYRQLAFVSKQAHPLGYWLYAAVPLLFLLLKPRRAGWGSWLLLAAATGALLPAAEHLYRHPCAWCGLGICAAYALILMLTGVRCGRVAWINYGSLMVLFTFIGLISDILTSAKISGLALIGSGVGLLLLTLLLARQRRRLVHSAKPVPAKQNATPAEQAPAPAEQAPAAAPAAEPTEPTEPTESAPTTPPQA